MKSFSRSQSPMVLSASSSQISLNLNQSQQNSHHNPPIYECLEKLTEPTIYRSRLNTALSNKEEESQDIQYQAPQAVIMRRVSYIAPLFCDENPNFDDLACLLKDNKILWLELFLYVSPTWFGTC